MKKCETIKLFYTENHKNSEMAFDFLKGKNVPFSAIDVERKGITQFLERGIYHRWSL